MDALTALAPASGPDAPSPARKDEAAAEEFEAWMVSFLAKQMRESVKGGPWSQGAMATFADLFDQEIGKRVAEGGGFGLKEAVLASWDHSDAPGARPPSPGIVQAGREEHDHEGGGVRLTSAFGARIDPLTGQRRMHHGHDLAAAEGTPVRAAADGTVRFAGRRGSYGNVVIVAHSDGTETRYAHCRDLDVKAGDVVTAGQSIASVGNTGRSTGAHLHYEVRRDGQAIDPASWDGGDPLAKNDR